jgi:hypothetical protein
MTARYERRCRTLLRAYPARYRQVRGDELLGTLLDAAEPGRTVPSPGVCWDVVRGGLMTRRRLRPPLHRWLLYRTLDVRLPYQYRWWARDDALGRWYGVRTRLIAITFPLLFQIVGGAVMTLTGAPFSYSWDQWPWLVGIVVICVLPIWPFEGAQRRGKLRKHEFTPDGTSYEALPPAGPAATPSPPEAPEPYARPDVLKGGTTDSRWHRPA